MPLAISKIWRSSDEKLSENYIIHTVAGQMPHNTTSFSLGSEKYGAHVAKRASDICTKTGQVNCCDNASPSGVEEKVYYSEAVVTAWLCEILSHALYIFSPVSLALHSSSHIDKTFPLFPPPHPHWYAAHCSKTPEKNLQKKKKAQPI